jgi:hypothetical protein
MHCMLTVTSTVCTFLLHSVYEYKYNTMYLYKYKVQFYCTKDKTTALVLALFVQIY